MIKAKKSLGQNFLTDRNTLEKIVETTIIKNKTVLEVGPGTGNLTSFILKRKPKKMIVVEKDYSLAKNLKDVFEDQLTIINDDILNIKENLLSDEKVTVFGNLPYNISTEILFKMLEKKPKTPSKKELQENIPSRSAKLRYIVKKDNLYNFETDIFKKFEDLIKIENFGNKL